jgi:ABC-type multidrug transport system ATPase subunit
MNDIVINNLSVSFDDKKVIQNFSHTFRVSSVTCLMGASGIGKTTLFRALMNLVKPQGGTIAGLPSHIAAVFQEDRLIEHANAVENILPVLKNTTYEEFNGLYLRIKPLLTKKSERNPDEMGGETIMPDFEPLTNAEGELNHHMRGNNGGEIAGDLGYETILYGTDEVNEGHKTTLERPCVPKNGRMGDRATEIHSLGEKLNQITTKAQKITKEHKISLIQYHLAVLGLSGKDSLEPVSALSGGMRRRVALVRAMLANASLILLDEAFKGLDEHTRRCAIAYVRQMRGEATLIYSTHEQEEARLMQGEMLTFDNGKDVLAVLSGRVIKGKALGRTLGFPTANLCVEGKTPPLERGVYAVIAILPNGQRLPAVLNQGKHPTVPEGEKTVEVHIIGFEGDLYGQKLVIEYRRFLRPEITFPSKDALSLQVQKDMKAAQLLLEEVQ